MKRPVLWAIGGYKQYVSPLLPPACRFVPSCSEYAYEAIARYGVLRGGYLATWRVLRCNPWGGHGYDPVPNLDASTTDAPTTNDVSPTGNAPVIAAHTSPAGEWHDAPGHRPQREGYLP